MNDDVIKVFIGFDRVESVAWHTMAHSILRHSSRPVAIIPVNLSNLKSIYTRDRDPKQSNEFSFSRFLVPHLCDYQGYGIFFDCDMMLRGDIAEIFDAVERDPGKAVYVVKHDYEPKDEIKYLNTVQYKYPRKNWSSVVLWSCGHEANKRVTVDYVNTATPMDLHRVNVSALETASFPAPPTPSRLSPTHQPMGESHGRQQQLTTAPGILATAD